MKRWLRRIFKRTNPGDVSRGDHWRVARPVSGTFKTPPFSWKNESVLILGFEANLVCLAREISDSGALVSFRSLDRFQDIYQIPLEHFTIIIMSDGSPSQQFDVVDVGGTLRRADSTLVLVWASSFFKLSEVAGKGIEGFCDIILALPSSPDKLALFLKPMKAVQAD